MPSVNMIALRRAEKKRLERLVYITLLVIVGELTLTLAVVGFMTARVHADNSQIRQLDRDMARIQPTVDKIRKYEAEIRDLEPRLELLGSSRDRTMLWHSILLDMGRCMPEKTWLNSLATTVVSPSDSPSSGEKSSSTATINLSGASVSQQLVGETMLRLNECPEFEKVDLTYTQELASSRSSSGGDEQSPANGQILQFQIAAKIRSNEPKKGGPSGHVTN